MPWQSFIWKKYSSWLVPWESFALVPIWTQWYLLWDSLWDIWTSSEVCPPGFWRQQVLVPTAWNKDIFPSADSSFRGNLSRHQNTIWIFSERLRLIFKLNTYTLICKTEDSLIFLFASTLMKRDEYINQASFPTDQTRKTSRSCGKLGVFMNSSMSEMLQTIREKQEDWQMTVERLWRKRLSILCGDRWES